MKRWVTWVGFSLLLVFATSLGQAQFAPAPGTGPGLPETIEAIDSARITTRILYVTAHPDDESSAILTYLARGLHADVALLSLTRGEGGQNDLGPEQAPQLGLIRTQELLAATRAYGVKLYFTHARDFGFSKTPEETQKIWGDAVLEDMVRVIRAFRPNVVIDNFGGVHFGHGHHQTAGLWTPKAVALAADPKAYPTMIHEVFGQDRLIPWDGDGLPVQVLDVERGTEKPTGYVLPVDEISPLYGKTYRDIGTDGFSNHHTQGVSVFLGSPFFRRPLALLPENGGKLDPASLAAPLHIWAERAIQHQCLPKGGAGCRSVPADEVEAKLTAARAATLNLDWKTASQALVEAGKLLERDAPGRRHDVESDDSVTQDHLRDYWEIQERVNRALTLVAGIRITADADRGELVVGEKFSLTTSTQCRPEGQCQFGEIDIVHEHTSVNDPRPSGGGENHFQIDVTPTIRIATTDTPPDPRHEQRLGVGVARGAIVFVSDKLLPEPQALYVAEQKVTIDGYPFTVSEPVTHVEATSTGVERVPLRLVPAYTLSVEPDQAVEVLGKPRKPFDILLRVHSHATQAGKVNAGLDVPPGWNASPPTPLDFSGTGDRYARLTLTPPQKLQTGTYKIEAYAQRGSEKFLESLEPLPTLKTQFWAEPAQCLVHAFDIEVPENLRVGYITAENEPIPQAMQRLGIRVDLLDAAALAFGDLSSFDAIVVGVRAYELRPDLRAANQRLFDYASNGGTLLVQYERDFAWNTAQYAPYPAKINNSAPLPRITDENSPVKFLKPDDPLLNRPNKITPDDFQGWVQERGLYFWTQFDPKYTALLAMNDPGEPDLNGGLVYTRYGKGIYIYTGIAFFRQLPEGVPGAYRLLVNLLTASGKGH